MNEQVVIDYLRNGNIDSLEILVKTYQLRAIRTAYLITQDQGTAEDVVQTAFLELPRRLQSFDVARSFEPWFMKCVVNDAIKATKQQARLSSLDNEADGIDFSELLIDPNSDPEVEAEAADIERIVREAMARLSAPQRAIIVMRYYLNMSERQISDETNLPPGTIKSRLNRARLQLSGWLKINMFFEDRIRG
jgi:RNA polymerase sigma-70 factor, ECF subfamily